MSAKILGQQAPHLEAFLRHEEGVPRRNDASQGSGFLLRRLGLRNWCFNAERRGRSDGCPRQPQQFENVPPAEVPAEQRFNVIPGIPHDFPGLKGRGFTADEIATPVLCSSRAPRVRCHSESALWAKNPGSLFCSPGTAGSFA
jgi:hypothetical protein